MRSKADETLVIVEKFNLFNVEVNDNAKLSNRSSSNICPLNIRFFRSIDYIRKQKLTVNLF